MNTHVLSAEELSCLEHCGSYPQYHLMRSQFEARTCPFCSIDSTINHILYKNSGWLVWKNSFSHDRHCETMLVIVSRWHIRNLSEISIGEWQCFHDMIQWINRNFVLSGGMLFGRFGDMQQNAGTVPHFHFNLWVPDGSGEVRVPIYKDAEDRARNRERALAFRERYEAGEVP